MIVDIWEHRAKKAHFKALLEFRLDSKSFVCNGYRTYLKQNLLYMKYRSQNSHLHTFTQQI